MNLSDDTQVIDFKRDDKTYIQLLSELADEGIYSVCSDEQGFYLKVLCDPTFNVWGVHMDYLSGAEDNRLQEQLRSDYWDCQGEYECNSA